MLGTCCIFIIDAICGSVAFSVCGFVYFSCFCFFSTWTTFLDINYLGRSMCVFSWVWWKYWGCVCVCVCVCVCLLVTQSCLTLCDPMDCSPLGFSVHGVLQARTLEWVAIPFSRVSFWPRDLTQGSDPALQADSLPSEPPGKPIGIHDICVYVSKLLLQRGNGEFIWRDTAEFEKGKHATLGRTLPLHILKGANLIS